MLESYITAESHRCLKFFEQGENKDPQTELISPHKSSILSIGICLPHV